MTTYYTLVSQDGQRRMLHAAAESRASALAQLGDEWKCKLTDQANSTAALYLLDEFKLDGNTPHVSNPTVPIYLAQ